MKKRILLIDDEESFLELMTTLIEANSDFEVIPSKWPEIATEMIGQYQPFAVVTDTNMPVMNGIELLQQIRMVHPELAVIVLFSGLKDDPQLTDQCVLKLGAKAVLSKSKALTDLLDLLKKMQ